MAGEGIEFVGPFWDGRGGAALAARLRTAVDATLARVQSDAAGATPVNTGAMRASIATRVEMAGAGATGVPSSIRGFVGSPLAYAPFVEFGSLPHWPPSDAIEAWVRRKLVDRIDEMVQGALPEGRQRKAGAKRPKTYSQAARGNEDLAERAVKSLTFLVRRSIATWGTPNARMMRNAVMANAGYFRRAVAAAINGFASDV